MNINRVFLIGFGNMGRALARGLQRTCPHLKIWVCTRHAPSDISETMGLDVSQLSFLTYDDLPQISEKLSPLPNAKDVLILAVKPQSFAEATRLWAPALLPCRDGSELPLVISILAGTPTSLIHQHFAGQCPVVRAMPNIAATVDEAATALAASPVATSQNLEVARQIFDSVGKSWTVSEELLDAVTGLSGSGPAYIYMVIEALSDGGVKMGMPRQLSLQLAAQTALGAARLVLETRQHPAILRDQVTTPGGTTISAIHELEKHGLRPMLISAVVKATRRSAALATMVEKRIREALKGR